MSKPCRHLDLIICLILTIAVLSAYFPIQQHDFVNLDDNHYVTENRHVNAGLTREAIQWAFSFADVDYWHPLTWLSHMLDFQLYGLNPAGHHSNNVLLHIANTLLLFVILKKMTGTVWRSAIVAAMFASHPLNVESVAWVAERKNLLSTFFWFLTIWSYARYSERPRLLRYVVVLLCFTLGILSKPMVVTLPFVLILLDYWPLGRFSRAPSADDVNTFDHELIVPVFQPRRSIHLLLEKFPLFILSAASIYISIFSLNPRGMVVSAESVSLWLRIENALVSYFGYIRKMILPLDLAVFYPYPEAIPWWKVVGALFSLACISVLVVRARQRLPYLVVGWFWYLGTLVPVIGLLQVGLWPAMADRFAYIPLVGVFIMIVWGSYDLVVKLNLSRILLPVSAAVVFLALLIGTRVQLAYWRNSTTLFKHALGVTTDNHLAHNNLGTALIQHGKLEEARLNLSEALRIMPDNALFHNNLGSVLLMQEKFRQAIYHFSEALRTFPQYAEAHVNLGVALSREGRLDEAMSHFRQALVIRPDKRAYHKMGLLLAKQGKLDEAIEQYYEALRIDPNDEEVHNNLGVALASRGKFNEALSHFSEALRIDPKYDEARHNLKVISMKSNDFD